jgi:hypothetical protein
MGLIGSSLTIDKHEKIKHHSGAHVLGSRERCFDVRLVCIQGFKCYVCEVAVRGDDTLVKRVIRIGEGVNDTLNGSITKKVFDAATTVL